MIASSFRGWQPFRSVRNHHNRPPRFIEHPIRIICQVFILHSVELPARQRPAADRAADRAAASGPGVRRKDETEAKALTRRFIEVI